LYARDDYFAIKSVPKTSKSANADWLCEEAESRAIREYRPWICPRVNAPAALMHLDLVNLDVRLRASHRCKRVENHQARSRRRGNPRAGTACAPEPSRRSLALRFRWDNKLFEYLVEIYVFEELVEGLHRHLNCQWIGNLLHMLLILRPV